MIGPGALAMATDLDDPGERRARGTEYAWVLPWVLASIGFLTTLALLH